MKSCNFTEIAGAMHEQDCITNEGALYLHGLIADFPVKIVVATARRVSSQDLVAGKIDFLCRKSGSKSEFEYISVGPHKIRVATVSQALVDLVAYYKLSAPLMTFASFFGTLPYDCGEVIEIARKTGKNSILKRILFWCLWAGRLKLSELPAEIGRTPVRVADADDARLLWEGSIQVFYPEELLAFNILVPANPAHSSQWLELRCFRRFAEYCSTSKWLPLADDQRKNSVEMVNGFYKQELFTQIEQSFTGLLLQLHGRFSKKMAAADRLPELFLDWVRHSSDFPACASHQLQEWVDEALSKETPELWEIAFIYSAYLRRFQPALERISLSVNQIFTSSCWNGIIELCEMAEAENHAVPLMANILRAHSLSRLGRFDDALDVLGRIHKNDQVVAEIVTVELAAGAINLQAGRIKQVLQHYFVVQSLIGDADAGRQMTNLLFSIGNLEFKCGNFEAARRAYLKTYKLFKTESNVRYLPSFRLNLGLIEYRLGNLDRASTYLDKALKISKKSDRGLYEHAIMVALVKVRLSRGEVFKAYKLLQVIKAKISENTPEAERQKIYSLLAFTHELMGRPLSSEIFWNKVSDFSQSKISSSSEYATRYRKAQQTLLRGKYQQAVDEFSCLLDFGRQKGLSEQDTVFALFYRAIALHQAEAPEAFENLMLAIDILGEKPNHPVAIFARVYAELHFPEFRSQSFLDDSIRKLDKVGFFEPIWIFVADQLNKIPTEAAKALLKRFFKGSPRQFIIIMKQRHKRAGKILQNFNTSWQCDLLTLKSDRSEKIISRKKYESWRTKTRANLFKFDAITGVVSFFERKCTLKTDSQAARILLHLLISYPEKVELSRFYELMWFEPYFEEVSWPAIKTSISRLRTQLKTVCPTIDIEVSRKENSIQIVLLSPYQVVF